MAFVWFAFNVMPALCNSADKKTSKIVKTESHWPFIHLTGVPRSSQLPLLRVNSHPMRIQ